MGGLVYYSSATGNTARLVAALGIDAMRIPIRPSDPMPAPARPFVLVCPTFADGAGRGAVPKQVIRFLNEPTRRALLRGVIGAGNRNFGATFALSGDVIAKKCNVPVLTRFELAGTDLDIARIRDGLDKFWRTECLMTV
ncbi:class Ib ribonucleoside-diphosphate reductase assembly flavoprotein NrdI [uncultured Sulfitobacter sp.]|uniref:class Ib ribonucleoside-diphosphate reductase assembly flavoprotein NrdI n=1 Tax=uncultured Sulfitobacter sp. TaxID=191468 RepID=UPI0030F7370D